MVTSSSCSGARQAAGAETWISEDGAVPRSASPPSRDAQRFQHVLPPISTHRVRLAGAVVAYAADGEVRARASGTASGSGQKQQQCDATPPHDDICAHAARRAPQARRAFSGRTGCRGWVPMGTLIADQTRGLITGHKNALCGACAASVSLLLRDRARGRATAPAAPVRGHVTAVARQQQ